MPELSDLANTLLGKAKRAGLTVVTAESCTAGLMCQVLSDAEGASEYFHGGFVTYTKAQKNRALGVSADLLRQKGAVCGEVARAMAEGALAHSKADLAAAITGVAGPMRRTRTATPSGACASASRGAAWRHAMSRRTMATSVATKSASARSPMR